MMARLGFRAVPGQIRDLLLAGALALAVWPSGASAQSACAGLDDFLAEIECLGQEFAAADAALNAAWPKVLANPPSGSDQEAQKDRIRASQRAWIAFRDADCEAKSDVGIPKYWEMNRLTCLIQHTRARTQDLLETYAY